MMSDDDLICICMTVSQGEIKNAIQAGNRDLDSLKSALFCCTGCGTCEGRVRALLKEELAKASAGGACNTKKDCA